MKKLKLFLAAAMLFTAFGANAQTEKGKMLAGGNLSFEFGSSKEKFTPTTGTVTENDGPKVTSLSFSPNIGYFFIDNLAGGLKLDLSTYNETSKQTFGSTTYDDKSNTFVFNVGPFLRYYYGLNDKMKVFGEGFFGFGIDNSKYTSADIDINGNLLLSEVETKINGTGFEVGPGIAYFLNENIAVEGLLTYRRFASKQENANIGTNKSSTGDVRFKIGFQIHL